MSWRDEFRPAALETKLDAAAVRCGLSPRNCEIKPGKMGFCGVRGNRDGRLVTFNYGKGVHATEETIETEAVNHFSPGERILSLGNVGCMLNCDYCHNWKTSQARFVSDKDVHVYTPEGAVATAKRHGIRMLSWTYNDPVVWHEFVIDTAREARRHGMMNVFKSAFYITPAAVEELIPEMDIFSISIKSMDPGYYRKLTKGTLQPVLDATKQVYRAGKHVEVSCLMVTDISDDEKTARGIADFVLKELGPEVPIHYVRFHPDYKMTDTIRTPVERLHAARAIAKSMGVKHVYLGNVFDADATSTWCAGCNAVLVTRFGLTSSIVGLDDAGRCAKCGVDANVKRFGAGAARARVPATGEGATGSGVAGEVRLFEWHGDIRSLHVQAMNGGESRATLRVRRHAGTTADASWVVTSLEPEIGRAHV
jgi:pyruvate formate lyase activating enzyme